MWISVHRLWFALMFVIKIITFGLAGGSKTKDRHQGREAEQAAQSERNHPLSIKFYQMGSQK